MSVTNTMSVVLRQLDAAGVDVIAPAGVGRTITFTFVASVGELLEVFSVPTSPTTITLPKSPCLQFYIKNLDPTNYVTVTWTENGGTSHISKNIRPGGFLAYSDLDAAGTAGITALSLQANTSAVLVEMFLGG